MGYPEGEMAELNTEGEDSGVSGTSPGLSPERLAELPMDVRAHIKGLHEQIRTLGELAGHDGLTGLDNRRRFDEALLREIASAAREGQPPLSLVMIDLDNFKDLNDLYGHLAGDQALKTVSQGILLSIRRYDQAFRYGGEELAVLLRLNLNNAVGVAERIRKKIAEEGPVTISLGVAQFGSDPSLRTDDEESLENIGKNLVKMADQALYAAKEAGRNRTAFYGLGGSPQIILPKPSGPKNSSGK